MEVDEGRSVLPPLDVSRSPWITDDVQVAAGAADLSVRREELEIDNWAGERTG